MSARASLVVCNRTLSRRHGQLNYTDTVNAGEPRPNNPHTQHRGKQRAAREVDREATRAFLRTLIDRTLGCAEIRVLEASINPRTGMVVPEATYSKTIAVWSD